MDMLAELKTDHSLLKALDTALAKKQTNDEIRAQRVSFIYGSMDEKSGVTRTRIEQVLAEQEGSES